MLSENKFSKYLFYAIGEIILVVIGILIALQLNNWNQNRQNKQKVDKLLSKIQKDIATDLSEINRVSSFYYLKDSLCQLVLSKKLNTQDYKNPNSGLLYTLVITLENISLKRNSYDNLMSVQDIIPEAYDSIVDKLNILYNDRYRSVELADKAFSNMVLKSVEDLHQNFSWFSSQNINSISDKQIDFLVNSDKYQSMVAMHQNMSVGNLMAASIQYLQDALTVYKDIDQLIENSTLSQTSLPLIPIDSSKVGLYKDITGNTITYQIKNKRHYLIDKDGTIEFHPFLPNKFFYPLSNLFMRFQSETDTTHLYLSVFENGQKPFATKID